MGLTIEEINKLSGMQEEIEDRRSSIPTHLKDEEIETIDHPPKPTLPSNKQLEKNNKAHYKKHKTRLWARGVQEFYVTMNSRSWDVKIGAWIIDKTNKLLVRLLMAYAKPRGWTYDRYRKAIIEQTLNALGGEAGEDCPGCSRKKAGKQGKNS